MSDQRSPLRGRYWWFHVPGEGGYIVAFQADAHPDWLKIVARFSDQSRAESYCDVENECHEDDEGEFQQNDLEGFSPPSTTLPPSRIADLIHPPMRALPAPEPEPELDDDPFTPSVKADLGEPGDQPSRIAPQESAEPAKVRQKPSGDQPGQETSAPAPAEPTRPSNRPVAGKTRVEQALAWLKEQGCNPVIIPTKTRLASLAGVPKGSLGFIYDDIEARGLVAAMWHDDQGRFCIKLHDEPEPPQSEPTPAPEPVQREEPPAPAAPSAAETRPPEPAKPAVEPPYETTRVIPPAPKVRQAVALEIGPEARSILMGKGYTNEQARAAVFAAIHTDRKDTVHGVVLAAEARLNPDKAVQDQKPVKVGKNDPTKCASPGCRYARQPGKQYCANCTATQLATKPRQRAGMVDV